MLNSKWITSPNNDSKAICALKGTIMINVVEGKENTVNKINGIYVDTNGTVNGKREINEDGFKGTLNVDNNNVSVIYDLDNNKMHVAYQFDDKQRIIRENYECECNGTLLDCGYVKYQYFDIGVIIADYNPNIYCHNLWGYKKESKELYLNNILGKYNRLDYFKGIVNINNLDYCSLIPSRYNGKSLINTFISKYSELKKVEIDNSNNVNNTQS